MKNKSKNNERILLFGRSASKLGDIIFDYANSVLITNFGTSAPILLAIYQSSDTIINILFNIIGGVFADKKNKKNILIITDLLCGLLCFFLSFFIKNKLIMVLLIISNMLIAIFMSFNSPTYKSIVKETIERERIGKFNSISNCFNELIKVVGPIISMLFVSKIGTQGALLINAATFFISAILQSFLIRIDNFSSEKNIYRNSFFVDLKEGVQYLFYERELLRIVIISSIVNFFLSGYNLLLPFLNNINGNSNKNLYAIALAYEALGGILGSIINSKIPQQYNTSKKLLTIFLFLVGLSLIFIPITFENFLLEYIILVPIIIFGIMLTIFNIRFITYVQLIVDEKYLGRIFSIIFTVASLFMPLGATFFSITMITSNIFAFYIIGIGIMIISLFIRQKKVFKDSI